MWLVSSPSSGRLSMNSTAVNEQHRRLVSVLRRRDPVGEVAIHRRAPCGAAQVDICGVSRLGRGLMTRGSDEPPSGVRHYLVEFNACWYRALRSHRVAVPEIFEPATLGAELQHRNARWLSTGKTVTNSRLLAPAFSGPPSLLGRRRSTASPRAVC
jgi:hypothetical protein